MLLEIAYFSELAALQLHPLPAWCDQSVRSELAAAEVSALLGLSCQAALLHLSSQKHIKAAMVYGHVRALSLL